MLGIRISINVSQGSAALRPGKGELCKSHKEPIGSLSVYRELDEKLVCQDVCAC